ncbi:MAG: hypothetical protein ACTHJM_00250 [Marmoricola sp.]
MTTQWGAGPVAPKRFFLGVVVPLLYIAAMTITVMIASSGHGKHAALASSESIRLEAVRDTPIAKPRTRHTQVHRLVTKRLAPRPHRPKAVSTPTPTPQYVAPVVSRSASRPILEEQPPVSLVIRVASVTTPATMQAAINECNGPVEIVWGFVPTEIAEHDYCGGAAFSSLFAGQRVQVVGGSMAGTYVVNDQRRFAAAGSSADQLSGIGDLALQTCVSDGVVLIGLDRVG